MFLVDTNSDSAKKEKNATFTLIYTYGTTMVLHKEGVYTDGRWESDCHLICRTYVHTKAKLEVEMGSVLIFLLLKLGAP